MGDVGTDTIEISDGNYVVAQLSSRYFHPGGVVRGVVELHTNKNEPDPSTEILYVVAQVHAHISVNSDLLTVPVMPLLSPRSASLEERLQIEKATQDAFFWDKLKAALPDIKNFSGETGTCIYQSAPHAVLSDTNIAPPSKHATREQIEETKRRCTREFAIALPKTLCPTFRGTSARVVYVVSITAQAAAANSKAVSVHLPFEVYGREFTFETTASASPSKGLKIEIPAPRSSYHDQYSPPPSPSRRFASRKKERAASLSMVPVGVRKGSEMSFECRPSLMHGRLETELLQKAQTSIFTIGKDTSHLVRLILPKQFYHPGECVLGVFDFTQATIPCYEIAASLVLEEVLGSGMSLDPARVVSSKTIATFHEYTLSTLQTNVRFCLPQDALPSIQTDLVCFRYVLQFAFTAGIAREEQGLQVTNDRQTFRWQTPIDVQPPIASEKESLANVPHKLFQGSKRYTRLE